MFRRPRDVEAQSAGTSVLGGGVQKLVERDGAGLTRRITCATLITSIACAVRSVRNRLPTR